MPVLSEDTDRRFAELAIARGLVDAGTVGALEAERTRQVARGESPRALAQTLCDKGLLDRAVAAALLKEVRAGRGLEDSSAARRIGRYAIVRELGKGGMGVVYEAFDETLQRKVAIKMILDPTRAQDEDLVRFRREAQAAARVPHPGIVQVFETGEHEGKPFLVMELVEGEGFDALLKRERVAPRRAAEIVRGVALALEHAHEQRVVHRDVKPANVLLDRSGKPHLTDFGLARDEAATAHLTATGDVLGTPAYMAPEQARGTPGEQGPHTDIYALGGLLYRALAGKPPFEGATAQALLYKVMTHEPVPLRRLNASVHADLETIALRCLEKEPARRYATAGAVADDLRRFLDGEPILARPTVGLERALRLVKRNLLVSSLVLALALLAVLAPVTAVYVKHAGDAERRRSAVDRAQKDAEKARDTFMKALRTEVLVYDPFRTDAQKEMRFKILDPGLEAIYSARRFFDLASQDGPDSTAAHGAGELLYETAKTLGDAALEIEDAWVARRAFAYALVARKGDPHAIGKCAHAESLDGQNHRLAVAASADVTSLRDAGDLANAERAAKAAVKTDGNCACAWLVGGLLAIDEGKLDEARDDLTRVIALKPRCARAYAYRALAAPDKESSERSMADATRAIELDPARAEYRYIRSWLSRSRGDVEGAWLDSEEALRRLASDLSAEPRTRAKIWTVHGGLSFERGDFVGAAADATRALQIPGAPPWAWAQRGAARDNLGDRAGAISDDKKFLDLAPNDPSASKIRARLAELEAGR